MRLVNMRTRTLCRAAACIAVAAACAASAQAGLQVSTPGKDYRPDPKRAVIVQRKHDASGNTSVRNVDAAGLKWREYGYYERSRDLGQVFTPQQDCRLDAIVLRTGNTEKAVLPGAPGAAVFLQIFEVEGEPRINDNGTPQGAKATHGFSTNHRCDDFIEGVRYRSVRVARGGVFPSIPPTCDAQLKPAKDQSGRLCAMRWDLTGEDELELKAGRRYAFMVGFEAPAPLRSFTLANLNPAWKPGPAKLGEPEDPYAGGWGLRREGNGACPPLMLPSKDEPKEGTAERRRLLAEAVFPEGEARFAIPPTTDGYPDVDTYRDLEFAIEVRGARGAARDAQGATQARPRLIVLTDIGGDPDDQQSMVRLMTYANEFEIEGLIASASGTQGELKVNVTKPELIREIVEAYGKVKENLAKHREGYPSAQTLLARIKRGNPNRGVANIGEGKDTEGSNWIIRVVDRPDPRPVCVTIWGGSTELAQALWRVRNDRTAAELEKFVGKLRVYSIEQQDDTGPWIVQNFPTLFHVLGMQTKGTDKRTAVYRGMYLGGDMSLTSKAWITDHVQQGHGPLGALYPMRAWTAPNPHGTMKEGDSPSWLYFVPNGLSDPAHPEYGCWGGRFKPAGEGLYRDATDELQGVKEPRVGVWRWRPAFQNDFAARMDWCVKGVKDANHAPLAALGGKAGRGIVTRKVKSGERVRLSASGSSEPDGNSLAYRWWVYPEAGTYADATRIRIESDDQAEATLNVPNDAQGKQIHVILEVSDDGEPKLTAHRRVILDVTE